MKFYPQSVDQSQWDVRDHLLSGLGRELTADRVRSEVAAHRFAVREALAEHRRQSPQPPRPRRLLAWRRTRQAVTKPA